MKHQFQNKRIGSKFLFVVTLSLFFLAVGNVYGWVNPSQVPYSLGFLNMSGGNVGANTPPSTGDKLIVGGGVSVGSGYAAANAGTNNLIIQGSLGIGTPTPASKLTVSGGFLLYNNFFNSNIGTKNMTVVGNVGVGTSSPATKLDIQAGALRLGRAPQSGRWNTRVPAPNVVSTIASGGTFSNVSMVIGADGLPIIASYNSGSISVVHCSRLDCNHAAAPNVTATISGASANAAPKVIVGANGMPVIGYLTSATSNLRVFNCTTFDCSQGSSTSDLIGFSGFSVQGISITVGAGGNPIFAVQKSQSFLKTIDLVFCSNPTCTSSISSVTTGVAIGPLSIVSLAMAVDGTPMFAHQTGNGGVNIALYKCGNLSCSSGIDYPISGTAFDGRLTLTTGSDGMPNILLGGARYFVRCGDLTCTSFTRSDLTVAGGMPVGSPTGASLTIGVDGLPLIVYPSNIIGSVSIYVLKCTNVACGEPAPAEVLKYSIEPNPSGPSGDLAIAVGSDGLPFVSYLYGSGAFLRAVRCGSDRCIPYWTRK